LIIDPLTRRAGQPHLNADQIKSLSFYSPPYKLQHQFADIVIQTEQLRERQRAHEAELEQLFKGLLQRYFG
jgi:type I restriction enzyme S subunit